MAGAVRSTNLGQAEKLKLKLASNRKSIIATTLLDTITVSHWPALESYTDGCLGNS